MAQDGEPLLSKKQKQNRVLRMQGAMSGLGKLASQEEAWVVLTPASDDAEDWELKPNPASPPDTIDPSVKYLFSSLAAAEAAKGPADKAEVLVLDPLAANTVVKVVVHFATGATKEFDGLKYDAVFWSQASIFTFLGAHMFSLMGAGSPTLTSSAAAVGHERWSRTSSSP